MTLLWNIRIIFLVIFQICISLLLIYKQKYKLCNFIQIFLNIILGVYWYFGVSYVTKKYPNSKVTNIYKENPFLKRYFIIMIILYVIVKILLYVIISFLRYFSFFALKSIANKGIISKIGYILFGKKSFSKFMSVMWNRVSYGIRFKKGIPGMVNKKHQSTGIHFDKNGFPKFKSFANVKLPWHMCNKTRETHFRYANKQMYERIKKDRHLKTKFTKSEINEFKEGNTPSRFTWHHHQDKGLLQLVERSIHEKVNHKGGYSIWGKKGKD